MINVSCTVFFSILYFMGITHFLISGSFGMASLRPMAFLRVSIITRPLLASFLQNLRDFRKALF